MILQLYTPPVGAPVSDTAAKLHARIDTDADDALVTPMVEAAVDWCEKFEGRSYMIRTYKAYLDGFQNEVYLPYPPLISVSSVQYVDSNGDTQTLSSSYYTVDTTSTPGRVYLAYNYSWPMTRDVPKSVTITYVAGYATTFTANFTTDVLTVGNAVFADGDIVRVSTDADDLPAALSADTDYYVRDVTGLTLKLAATSGGTAIDMTDAGTGTHYIGLRETVPFRCIAAIKLVFSHLYENREMTTDLQLNEVPVSAKALLSIDRVFS